MRVKWNSKAKKAFRLYAFATSVVCQWPMEENSLFLQLRAVVWVLEMVALITALFIRLYINCGTPDDAFNSILLMIYGVLVINKLVVLYSNREELAIVYSSAYADWENEKDKECLMMMEEYSNMSNKVTTFYYSANIPTIIMYVIAALASSGGTSHSFNVYMNTTDEITSRRYILPGSCVYDSFTPFFYYLLIPHQFLQLMGMCFTNTCSDVSFGAIANHLSGQFGVLQIKMQRIGRDDDLKKNKEMIVQIILRHQHLLQLAGILEEAYCNVIFGQMLMGVIMLSIGGFTFLLSVNSLNLMGIATTASLMQFMLLEIYLFTYPSDNITSQADKMLFALYSSHWYKLPISYQKFIIFMMMKVKHPPYLTAGKFFNVSRMFFMDVLKTAGSYLSVLRVMMEQ